MVRRTRSDTSWRLLSGRVGRHLFVDSFAATGELVGGRQGPCRGFVRLVAAGDPGKRVLEDLRRDRMAHRNLCCVVHARPIRSAPAGRRGRGLRVGRLEGRRAVTRCDVTVMAEVRS